MEMNFGGKLKEFRIRCEQAGLQLHFEEDLPVPYAQMSMSGQTSIHLPLPDPMWDKAHWVEWEYMAEHELGHIMPKTIDAYDTLKSKKIMPDSFLGSMLNIAEDNRQEWTDYYVLEGRKNRLNNGRNQFLNNQDASKLGKTDDEHMLAFQAYYCWDTLTRESWMPALIGQADRMLDHMTDQQLEWIDKLRSGGYETTLKSGLTSLEMYNYLLKIIEEVFGFDADEEESNAQEPQEGDGEGEETDAEGSRDSEGKEAKEFGEGEGADVGGVVRYSDLLAHVHGREEEREDNTSYSSLKIEYGDEQEDFTPRDPTTYTILDYTKDQDCNGGGSSRYREAMLGHSGDGLAKHVRRLLQVRSASTYQHGLKRGKISPKSIYRAGNKGHAMEKRVFKKKLDNDVLNTAVFVLCDMSGSMGGDKMVQAGISCKLLNEAIGKLGVPLEMAGFDDHYDAPKHAIWKTFSKPVSSEVLIDRITDSIPRMMSGNSDGESILWAYNRLISRKEKRKILIVLSDGSPAGYSGDCMAYTKTVVKEIEKGRMAEIYGIGIEDWNVKLIYKDNTSIDDASELEAALLKVITGKILN